MGQQSRTRRERRELARIDAKIHPEKASTRSLFNPYQLLVLLAIVLVGAYFLVGQVLHPSASASSAAGDSGSQMDMSSGGSGAVIGKHIHGVDQPVPSTFGRDVSLADYRGKKLIVFFYEGANCGSCQQQLKQLQSDLPTIRKAGGDVVAVTTDPVDASQDVAKQLKLGYPILQDLDHHIGSTFKDFHLVTAGMDMGPVDNHAVFILDRKGFLRWKTLAGDSMWVQPDKIMTAIRQA